MTARDMQIAFEMEANIQDPSNKPSSYEIFYWINRAIDTFIKTRWDGNNPKQEGFEQTQKRIDDLRTLVKLISIGPVLDFSTYSNNTIWTLYLPIDYLFTLGEEVTIRYVKNGHQYSIRQGITESSADRYSKDLNNPFSEHIFHNNSAKPLRIFKMGEGEVELTTDGNYSIFSYHLRYLAKPTIVALPSTHCNLPEHTHYEIVKIATKMYLETTKDPRYQTYNNEIVTME